MGQAQAGPTGQTALHKVSRVFPTASHTSLAFTRLHLALTFYGDPIHSPGDGGLRLTLGLTQQDSAAAPAVYAALWLLGPAGGLCRKGD